MNVFIAIPCQKKFTYAFFNSDENATDIFFENGSADIFVLIYCLKIQN